MRVGDGAGRDDLRCVRGGDDGRSDESGADKRDPSMPPCPGHPHLGQYARTSPRRPECAAPARQAAGRALTPVSPGRSRRAPTGPQQAEPRRRHLAEPSQRRAGECGGATTCDERELAQGLAAERADAGREQRAQQQDSRRRPEGVGAAPEDEQEVEEGSDRPGDSGPLVDGRRDPACAPRRRASSARQAPRRARRSRRRARPTSRSRRGSR